MKSVVPSRLAGTLGGVGLVAALVVSGFTAAPAAAANDTIGVDFASSTGVFQGGATGTLYGFSDGGVPSQALVDGAHITNTSQKPPAGLQHPNGDALNIESAFFTGSGKDIYVYLQDEYPDWPYNGGQRPGDANHDGVWDYLPIVQNAVDQIATHSAHPANYVFIPFNEPDGGNWYANWATMKNQFLSDWSAAYTTIEDVYAAHGLGHARIGGPGDSTWHADRTTDLLTYAKMQGQLPDVFIWHELCSCSTANFPSNLASFKSIEDSLNISPIPVDITEYGLTRDMSDPGNLIQWISMFENAKVDAQTAYWNYAGNFDDNSSRTNGANGGWWLFNWYGNLTGDTVRVTPPSPNSVSTLQGLATIDTQNKVGTVLLGGGSSSITLNLSGLSTGTFGSSVDAVVRADRISGGEGAEPQPPVVLSTNLAVSNGTASLTIPNADPNTAYQVQITPSQTTRPGVSNYLVNSTEAENATLTDATVYAQDPNNTGLFQASNAHDVGSFNKVDSKATWNVTAPTSGTYRLSVLAGANATPGEHALFVDGNFNQLIKYSADLGWTYRGNTDVMLSLSAGPHALSIRTSQDGTSVLPGADITLDRFDLYNETAGEATTYPATLARLSGGAALSWSSGTSGFASITSGQDAKFFISTADTGYYDITADYNTSSASDISVAVGGRNVSTATTSGAGAWRSTIRVFLSQGISEIDVTSANGVKLSDISTLRGTAQKASDSDTTLVDAAQAESMTLSGTAVVDTLQPSAGSNGSADANGVVKYVGYIGNGAGNTISMTRQAGFGSGAYVLTISAANAEKDAAINYNPQLVDRFFDVSETGGSTTVGAFRNNYSWISFWNDSIPLQLSTSSGALTISNPTAYAPDIDTVTLAKLVGGTVTTAAR